ncbi:MAG: DUF5666 domain-containing protein [Limnobacter sp.]|nr:DUF5666 domain-containing protein [Limnobacter sp.]
MSISMTLSLTLLAACGSGTLSVGSGGNGGVAGVGSGGTGFVTGFGSVIVDGIRYDDKLLDEANRIEVESTENSGASAGTRKSLGLGQRVELELNNINNGNGSIISTISKIKVESDLVGFVTAPANGNSLEVAGQRVVINTNSGVGPVTFLEGFSNIANLTTNDRVEVHGVLNTNNPTANANASIQASRIELLPSNNAATGASITATKVSGIASGTTSVNTSSGVGTQFILGNLTVFVPANATVTPNGSNLRNGAKVKVFSSTAPQNGSLTANAIRIEQFQNSSEDYRLSGVVTSSNPAGRTFVLDGLTVDGFRLEFQPFAGQSVQVRGSLNASTQVLSATELRVNDPSLTAIELKGSITNYVSNADFSVRNTRVNAAGFGTLSGLGNGVFVEVKGTVENGVVLASQVDIKSPMQDSELEQSGTVSGFNAAARTFLLGNNNISYSNARFENGSAQDLANGVLVAVEGRLSNGIIQAREIEFRSSNREMDLKGVLRANATSEGNSVRFTINGVSLLCTPNSSNPNLQGCNGSTLRRGVEVEVRYQNTGGNNLVSRLKVDNQR